MSSVVDLIADREVALGILPLGTANSFARTLGLPLSLQEAVDVIALGKVADADLARIDHDLFVNSASLGLSMRVARATPATLKRRFGTLAYLTVATVKFLSHRPFCCRITTEDGTFCFDALQVILANGGYHGGLLVAPRAHPESREILIQVVTGKSRWSLLRAWLTVALRRRLDPSIVTELSVRQAVIEADPLQYVSVDGEVAARTPVRITVAPESLALMVPPDFDDRD